MPINTRKVTGRREVRFETLGELRADVERVRGAALAGSVEALGNWTAGQAMQHLARFIACSIDGFGWGPIYLRPMGMVLQVFMGKKLLHKPPPPGMRLPENTPFFPDKDVSVEAGAAELLGVLDRVEAGERFTQKSPLLGRLSHERWIELHLRHAELHLSFFKV